MYLIKLILFLLSILVILNATKFVRTVIDIRFNKWCDRKTEESIMRLRENNNEQNTLQK